MTLLLQSPLLFASDAIELSAGTWQKRLLPIGQIEYKGRVLTFDRKYLQGLAQSYSAGAYSQVPFQLADSQNTHTNDPERFRGEVTGMDVTDDGLYVTVQTTDAGNTLLRSNPKLGVSARIVEDYARSDGQYYPVAIQHVLGTLDPRIPDLGDWQPVEMSNGVTDHADMVIDLSQCEWDGEPGFYDFAGGSQGHPLSPGLRGLADDLDTRHPDMSVGDHVRDAANMMDIGMHDAAKRHLRAAIGNMTPQSLMRHGHILDSPEAKRSMDDIHRHLLLVQQDQDEGDGGQETDHHPDVKARQDVTQPVPAGQQRMGTYANDGGGLEFAGGDPWGEANAALELAHQQAAQRQAEDARDALRLARRRTGTGITEDRLSAAMARIGRGTYTASGQQRAMGFANDAATDAVDRAADQAGGWGYSACTCTEDGIPAMTAFHTIGCPESEISPDIMGELAGDGTMAEYAVQPAADANGNVFYDQYGVECGMTELVQASTGERLVNSNPGGFETGYRQERRLPQRTLRFGDPDDPGDPGEEMTSRSQAYVRGLAQTLGLASPTAEQARERGAQRLAQAGTARRYRTYADALNDPLVRQRAEQIKGGGQDDGAAEFSNGSTGSGHVMLGWDDGCRLPGELTGLTYG